MYCKKKALTPRTSSTVLLHCTTSSARLTGEASGKEGREAISATEEPNKENRVPNKRHPGENFIIKNTMFRLQRLAALASKRPCQRIVTQRMAAFSDSITVSEFPDSRDYMGQTA